MINRIALVTDFGQSGPYLGQIKLRLSELAPEVEVIDLVSDLPPFRPDLAAYLLPALLRGMPARTLYLCVVDPGVGSERAALAVRAAEDWYLGPDNGLLALVARRTHGSQVVRVDWRPQELSDSFHGRDLFAPAAAMLCRGMGLACTEMEKSEMIGADWDNQSRRVIYVDRFGNLMTGLHARAIGCDVILRAGKRDLRYARTFCEVSYGQAFWYENSVGLIELAVNQGRANDLLHLDLGDPVSVQESPAA